MLRFVVAAACVAGALAGCPNLCSGHGTCSGNDICTCFANWQGPDCSLRTCAFGNAWALDAADPHGYEECSGAGLCDRSSGECKCFPGFTGYACQRSECPNDCSGHGLCRSLGEVKAAVPYSADKWDADQIQACVCDAGFFGTDCSQRRCPTGDDPLTSCVTPGTKAIQEIRVSLAGVTAHSIQTTTSGNLRPTTITAAPAVEQMDVFGTVKTSASANTDVTEVLEDENSAQFRVGFVDAAGQTYYAPTSWKAALSAEDVNADLAEEQDKGAINLEMALENIAGNKVRDVTVRGEYTSATEPAAPAGAAGAAGVIEKRYIVEFNPDNTNSANVGLQNTLVCDSGYGCSSPGCQPIVKMPFLYRYAALDDAISTLDEAPGAPAAFKFYTGHASSGANQANDDALFAAKEFLRLHPDSMPILPVGSIPGASGYDIRVVVAVKGPATAGDPHPYWTKVSYGNNVITADKGEYDPSSSSAGVYAVSKAGDFWGTLKGFTYRGFIPATEAGETTPKATIPDAPGVTLSFPSRDMGIAAGDYKFFEILVKLPVCSVKRFLKARDTTATPPIVEDFNGIDGVLLKAVDQYLENVECSNRGQCNRASGLCECYEGYYGVACHQQTVLV